MAAGYQSSVSWMHIKRASGRGVKIGTQYLHVSKHLKQEHSPNHILRIQYQIFLFLFSDPPLQINQERREEETGK